MQKLITRTAQQILPLSSNLVRNICLNNMHELHNKLHK